MRETSCIRAVSSGNPAIDRFDTLVHALASFPDSVTLRLSGAHNRASLCLIARAYGIEDRLVFSPADTDGGMVVAHVGTAQGHPNETTSAVLFHAAGDPRDDSDGLTLAELIDRFKDKTDKASLHEDCGLLSQARIAVITNLPAPYRIPLFSTIAVRLGEQGAAFRVFFLGPGDHDRPWMSHRGELGFPFQMLHSLATSRGHRPRLLPLDLELALRRFKPTMIVCGGLSPAVALRASLAARALGAVFGVWSGDNSRMSTAQSRLRRVTRQLVARRARFALAYGSLSAEYLRDLNGELPTVIARNTSALAQHSGRPESQPDAPLQLLAVGDLASRRKGIDILIAALRRLPDLRCRLRVVGSGAMLTDLAALSRDDPRVEFLGAVPPARMPQTYSDAEVFLFLLARRSLDSRLLRPCTQASRRSRRRSRAPSLTFASTSRTPSFW